MQIRSAQTREKRNKIWWSDFMESGQELHPIDEDGSEINTALKKCIENLKKEQKRCIELFYYNNKCYNEIALILNMDEKKVKSHLQNAKRNLKICLENKNVKED
jgi:RNA polymerase sigma-70 factor (ECF subfamily)